MKVISEEHWKRQCISNRWQVGIRASAFPLKLQWIRQHTLERSCTNVPSVTNEYLFWINILHFKKMNIFFEWIFWILSKWIFRLNKYSGFLKNEYLFWMNILDFYKMYNVLNKYFGISLPASKIAVAKCLKLMWNHSGIIRGT